MATVRQVLICFFVMYSSDAKFKEQCSSISGDILDWVLHQFSETTFDVITFLTKT